MTPMHLETHLPLLLDLILKSAVLLAFAGLLLRVCRRASAANRHIMITPVVVQGSIENQILEVLEGTGVFLKSEVFDEADWAGISNAQRRAATMQPLRHCEAGLSQPENKNVFTVVIHQRNFKVDKPNNTSIIEIIQNRTTTWVSFQPFCSK